MLVDIVFFILAFATTAALLWSGMELLRDQEDPLGDRLEELQSNAMVVAARAPRLKGGGGGFLNTFLYLLSLLGLDGWLRESQRELHQAGYRTKVAVAVYAFCNLLFLLALLAGAIWLQ